MKILILFIISFVGIEAQSISLEADLVNRYIWRGLNPGGKAAAIQPDISMSAGHFSIGFWGSYSLAVETDRNGNNASLDEIDFYTNYNFDFKIMGRLDIGFTDYMNPESGLPFSNFRNYSDPGGPGAHYIELNSAYSGPPEMPIYISFNIFLYNVKDYPVYLRAGYNATFDDTRFELFAGGTTGSSAYYGTADFEILDAGFIVKRSISFGEKFNLPIFGSVIINPFLEHLYYVIGITI